MENDNSSNEQESQAQINISEPEIQLALEQLRAEQNLVMAIVAGLLAAVFGAGVWAAVTVLTAFQIGWMAIGIGIVVGWTIRIVGKGLDQIYGIAGAILSLIGCALGNLLSMTYFIADAEGFEYGELLAQMTLPLAIEIMSATFSLMDILFYAIAVYFGYKYAFRAITEEDLTRALGKSF